MDSEPEQMELGEDEVELELDEDDLDFVDFEREDRYMRQLGIAHPARLSQQDVTLIGAGGIGSFVGMFLGKMGIQKVTVYDDDTVENHNIPNQAFPIADQGMSKSKALAYLIANQAGDVAVEEHEERVGDNSDLRGVVISAVDSMEARKAIWQSVKKNADNIPLYIEARMGAEVLRIQAFDPSDPSMVEKYEDKGSLYTDEEATEDPCTARAIVYNGGMAAVLISNLVKRHVMEENVPREVMFDFTTLDVPGAGLFVSE